MADFLRKLNRLPPAFYRGQRIYFVTICCYERRKLLSNARRVEDAVNILKETCFAHCFQICAYCFMPDHLHLLLRGQGDSASLPRAVRAFKGVSSAHARRSGISKLWQKGFYDHVLRSGEAVERIAWYILLNPVRKGLAKKAADWPYSDSLMPNWRKSIAPAEPYVPPWKQPVAQEGM